MFDYWTVGRVRVEHIWGPPTEEWGLEWPPFGIVRHSGGMGPNGEQTSRNYRGELLPIALVAGGRFLATCRTVRIAVALAADLARLDVDWSLERSTAVDVRRAVAPIVARWACEGDACLIQRYREAACSVAGLGGVTSGA